jgi:hypothetical protein
MTYDIYTHIYTLYTLYTYTIYIHTYWPNRNGTLLHQGNTYTYTTIIYTLIYYILLLYRNGTLLHQGEVVQFSVDLGNKHNSVRVVEMFGFFNESYSLNHNVFLSTENFMQLKPEKIIQVSYAYYVYLFNIIYDGHAV